MDSILGVLLGLPGSFGSWGLPGSPPANWKPFTGGEAGFISPPAVSTNLVLTELTATEQPFHLSSSMLIDLFGLWFTWKRTTTTKFPLAHLLSCKLYTCDYRSTASVKRYRGRGNPSSQLSRTFYILQEFLVPSDYAFPPFFSKMDKQNLIK